MSNRRKFTEDFRREAVRLLEHRGKRTAVEVAAELDVSAAQLYQWKKKYPDTAAAARDERGESPEQELKRLRREVAYLKRQQEILKKATVFFAKESEQ